MRRIGYILHTDLLGTYPGRVQLHSTKHKVEVAQPNQHNRTTEQMICISGPAPKERRASSANLAQNQRVWTLAAQANNILLGLFLILLRRTWTTTKCGMGIMLVLSEYLTNASGRAMLQNKTQHNHKQIDHKELHGPRACRQPLVPFQIACLIAEVLAKTQVRILVIQ